MHLRNHENFYKIKHKFFSGGFCLGGVFLGGFCLGGFCQGIFVLGVFVLGPFGISISQEFWTICNLSGIFH